MSRHLFLPGPFTGTNGVWLPHKVECDALSQESINTIAKTFARRHRFSRVYGVPRGGLRLETALRPFCTSDGPEVMADDVYTTGGSMEREAKRLGLDDDWIGYVIFAWFPPPAYIRASWVAPSWMHEEPIRRETYAPPSLKAGRSSFPSELC